VADVVQQSCDPDSRLQVRVDVIGDAELGYHPRREMVSTQRVCEPGMLRCLVSKVSQAELPYSPQPLELGRIHQSDDEAPLVRIGIDPDYVMNRIAVDPFGQKFTLIKRSVMERILAY
jgi:hypothetical protein